jgi:Cu-Zn family superoxide dismutase
MTSMTRSLTLAALLCAAALPAAAQEAATEEAQAEEAQAEADAATSQGGTGALVNADGTPIGNASVALTESANALVVVQAEGLPEGVHAVHLHMVGECEGPTFETAGGHIAGGHDHGVMADTGPHPGDLPNAPVEADGVRALEAFAIGLTADMLFDEDGSALIVHSAPEGCET